MSLKILIVEDDELSRALMCFQLKSWNYDTFQAKNGKEALQLLTTQAFDLLLLDYSLGDMTGLNIVNHISTDTPTTSKFYKPQTIIAISANFDDPTAVQEWREVGVFHVLPKPFSKVQFEQAINDLPNS